MRSSLVAVMASIGPRRERLGTISRKVLLGTASLSLGVLMGTVNQPPGPTSACQDWDHTTGVPGHSSGPPVRFFGGTARIVTVASASPWLTH